MVIPTSFDVRKFMEQVSIGKLTTLNEIRKAIAIKYNVDKACLYNNRDFRKNYCWC